MVMNGEKKPSGPEPIELTGGRTGVLLVHGFTGTTSEMRPLAEHLHREGFTVYAPLLAGHGVTPEELEVTRYPDWVQSAREGYERLKKSCDRIYLIGHSMGGAIVLHLAANLPNDGVVTMCAPIFVTDSRAKWTWLLSRFVRWQHKKGSRSPHVEKHTVHTYKKTPLRCVASLMSFLKIIRADLKRVQAPVFVMQSDRDETVQPRSAEHIHHHVSSAIKKIKRYPKSGHMLPVDSEMDEVFSDILVFLQETS
jgi:carboxylesterase